MIFKCGKRSRANTRMRRMGRRKILVFCGNERCHHQAELDADRWPGDVTFGDLQARMVCSACGHKGADVWPDWGGMNTRTLR